jgi:hypothetical protein
MEGAPLTATSAAALAASAATAATAATVTLGGIREALSDRWDDATLAWAARATAKAACLRARRSSSSGSPTGGVAFFLYHMRKAAGTTVRSFLEGQCRGAYRRANAAAASQASALRHAKGRRGRRLLLRAPPGVEGCLFESEGLSLPPGALDALEGAAAPPSSSRVEQPSGDGHARSGGLLTVTVTTLRHPVDRALSLYW